MDGFTESEYEGVELPLLVCDRCGYDTFSETLAKEHLERHAQEDANAETLAALQEVTEPDYGPEPPEPPKPRAKKKVSDAEG